MKSEIVQRLSALDVKDSLSAPSVLDDARAKDSPLHGEFEWDDSVAAEQHRLDQARNLIRVFRSVVVINNKTYHAPVFVEAPNKHGQESRYVRLVSVKSDYEKATEVLRMEFARVRSALERTQAVAAVLGLEDELQMLVEQLFAIERKVAPKPPTKPPTKRRPTTAV